ncbi:MAG: hypothetical protein AAFP20_07275 [Cyanobacteria bacterium J06614_10]
MIGRRKKVGATADRAVKLKRRDATRSPVKRIGTVNRTKIVRDRLKRLFSRRTDSFVVTGNVRDNVFTVESPGEYDAVFWRDDGGRKAHIKVDRNANASIVSLKDNLQADLEDVTSLRIRPTESQREVINTLVIEADNETDFQQLARDLIDDFNRDNPTKELVLLETDLIEMDESTDAVVFKLLPAFSQLKVDLVAESNKRKSNLAYRDILDSLDDLIDLEETANPTLQTLNDQLDAIASIQASLNAAESTSLFNKRDRNSALARLATRLNDRKQTLLSGLGDRVQRYLNNSPANAPQKFSQLLQNNRQIRQALFNPSDTLATIVDSLPNTAASHAQIEALENALINTPMTDTIDGKQKVREDLLSVDVHKIFYQKKTEILENVIEAAIAETDQAGLAALADFGKGNYWKILIDGKVHAQGDKHFYDRSKGFMGSMMKGLRRIVNNIDTPLTTDFIKALHRDATELVTTETNIFPGIPIQLNNLQETGLKQSQNAWGVTKDYSEAGMQELEALRNELDELVQPGGYFGEDNFRFQREPERTVQWSAGKSSGPNLQETVTGLMDHVIAKAYREIELADNDQDRVIGAIVDCCRGLGIIHPFKDANGRLMMFMVLNKMLMEQGLPPTILQDQGLMVGKSKAELVDLIKAGQRQVTGQ